MILVGSWITHTSTATIAVKHQEQIGASIVDISPDLSAPDLGPNTTASNSAIEVANLPIEIPSKIEEKFQTISHTVKNGESLGVIFRKLGLDLSLPYKISKHESASELVSLSIGKELVFKIDDEKALREIVYPKNSLQEFIVKIDQGTITEAKTQDLPFQVEQRTVSGEISSSLYEAALEVGMSNSMVMEIVRIFGWDIDFVLDIRAGDSFHVIHNSHVLNGKKLSDGDILAAEFTTQGQVYRAFRFEDSEGNVSLYNPEGKSMLGTFLRSPVEFSRISSRFGKRKHPILKKWRAHNGVDYAASRGTPIRATADGKVVSAGTKGGYGKTVVLRHAGRFSTLYAHMNGYAQGIKSGARVKQGQVIGYIGSTGLATGPHLHYEFRVDGVHRNSLTYKTPKASSVSEKFKEDFKKVAEGWSKKLNSMQHSYQIAKAQPEQKLTESSKL